MFTIQWPNNDQPKRRTTITAHKAACLIMNSIELDKIKTAVTMLSVVQQNPYMDIKIFDTIVTFIPVLEGDELTYQIRD